MASSLRRFAHALANLAAEDRPAFKRIDASVALPDDGAWLSRRN